MSLIARSARNFSVQIVNFVITLADRVILTGLLIRAWGVDVFSDWATLLAATGLVAMADLGFHAYLGNMLSRARIRARHRVLARLVRLGLVFYGCLALLLLGGAAALAWSVDIGALLNLQGGEATAVFLLLAALQILRISRSAVSQIYRGMGEFHRFSLADVRTMGVSTLGAVVAVMAGAGPLTVAILYLAIELLLGTLLTAYDVQKRYSGIRLGVELPTRSRIVGTGRALKWYGLYQILVYALLNLPVLIIAWLGLSGPLLVMFVVQRTLVNFARTVGSNLTTAAGVELARLIEAKQRGGYQTGVESLARINAALAGLMTSGLLVFGNDIVGIWTGRPELGSLTLLVWLLLPVIVLAPAAPLHILSVYTDRLRPQAMAQAVHALIAIPGAVIAGAHFGIVGVAAAVAIGEIVAIGIVAPALTARSLVLDYLRLVRAAAIVFAAALVWSGAAAWLVQSLIGGTGAAAILLRLAAWGVVGALPVLWFGLPARVQHQAVGLLRSRVGSRGA